MSLIHFSDDFRISDSDLVLSSSSLSYWGSESNADSNGSEFTQIQLHPSPERPRNVPRIHSKPDVRNQFHYHIAGWLKYRNGRVGAGT
jgi:hypothetical protein